MCYIIWKLAHIDHCYRSFVITNLLDLHEHQAVKLCQFENISHHAMRVEVIGYSSVFS